MEHARGNVRLITCGGAFLVHSQSQAFKSESWDMLKVYTHLLASLDSKVNPGLGEDKRRSSRVVSRLTLIQCPVKS